MSRGAPDGYGWQAPVSLRGIGGSNHYVVDFALPPGGSSAAPETQDVVLVDGWIGQLALVFPPGPATLAHVQVWVDGLLKYPSLTGQDYHPDNMIVIIPCDLDVPFVGSDYKIQLQGWNTDDTWQHTIQCHVWVIPY